MPASQTKHIFPNSNLFNLYRLKKKTKEVKVMDVNPWKMLLLCTDSSYQACGL